MPTNEQSNYKLMVPVYYNTDGTIKENVETEPKSLTKGGEWLKKDMFLNCTFNAPSNKTNSQNSVVYLNYDKELMKKALVIPFKLANWSTPETPDGFVADVEILKKFSAISTKNGFNPDTIVHVPYKAKDFGRGKDPNFLETELKSDIVSIKVLPLTNGEEQKEVNGGLIVVNVKSLFSAPKGVPFNPDNLSSKSGCVYKIKVTLRSSQDISKVIGNLVFHVCYYLTIFKRENTDYNSPNRYYTNRLSLINITPDDNSPNRYYTNRLSLLNITTEDQLDNDLFPGVWLSAFENYKNSYYNFYNNGTFTKFSFVEDNNLSWNIKTKALTDRKDFLSLVFKTRGIKDKDKVSLKFYYPKRDGYNEDFFIPFNNTVFWLENMELLNSESQFNSNTFEFIDDILSIKIPIKEKILNESFYINMVVLEDNVEKFMIPLFFKQDLEANDSENIYYALELQLNDNLSHKFFIENEFYTNATPLQANLSNTDIVVLPPPDVQDNNIFATGFKINTTSAINYSYTGVYDDNDFSIFTDERWTSSCVLDFDNNADFVLHLKILNDNFSHSFEFFKGGNFLEYISFSDYDYWMNNASPLDSSDFFYNASLVFTDKLLTFNCSSLVAEDFFDDRKVGFIILSRTVDSVVEKFCLKLNFTVFSIKENGILKRYKKMSFSLINEHYSKPQKITDFESRAQM